MPYEMTSDFTALPSFGDKIQQIIMPLVTRVNGEFKPLGTGFMIGSSGLMMTAKHVVEYAERTKTRKLDENGKFYDHIELYALFVTNQINEEDGNYFGGPLPIQKVWYANETDIAYCWINKMLINDKQYFFDVVRLSPGLPKVDDPIIGFGYYKMKADTDEDETSIRVEYSQETAFTRGKIVELHPVKRDEWMLNFPCFHTNARFDPGMSGGPIFNKDGNVCGIVCSSMPPTEDDPQYLSYGSLLWFGLGIKIQVGFDGGEPQEITIFELAKRGLIIT
jgi:hypothetical protein